MKNFLLTGLLAVTFVATFFAQACKTTATSTEKYGVHVSKDVIKTADWAGFKYEEAIEKAVNGDQKAMENFLNFFGTIDPPQFGEHAIACVELIKVAGDRKFGFVIWNMHNDKMSELLRRELQLAMAQSTNPELQGKKFEEVFPLAWKGMNGETVQWEEVDKDQQTMRNYKSPKDNNSGAGGATISAEKQEEKKQ